MNGDALSRAILVIADLSKLSRQLPSGGDYQFHSSFPSFRTPMIQLGHRLVHLQDSLLASSTPLVRAADRPQGAPLLSASIAAVCGASNAIPKGKNDMVAVFETIVTASDALCDRAEKNFIGGKESEVGRNAPPAGFGGKEKKFLDGQKGQKPQELFEDKVDNSNTPWVPWFLRDPLTGAPSVPQGFNLYNYSHPYEEATMALKYGESFFRPFKPHMYGTLEGTPVTWVDTPGQLAEMVAVLSGAREIAIDLEAHSLRSFQGITCLMQISTRTEDFLVDTIELRSHMHALQPVLANPAIIKVLHGADWDVLWLQRDFGLYVVSLFDTSQAARVLELRSFGLAHLLRLYCGVEADKKYQLADWRLRPLSSEMLKYAREDTHYLLYIFDRLRLELLERGNEQHNLMISVLNRSNQLCLRKYEKELLEEKAWRRLRDKTPVVLTAEQERVSQALFIWRDTVARELDESTNYVLPNNLLFKMAESMPQSSLEVSSRFGGACPVVRRFAVQVAQTIQQAAMPGYVPVIPNFSGAASSSAAAAVGEVTPSKPRLMDMASPIDTRFSPRPLHSSPVLTTDGLFSTAGWEGGVEDDRPIVTPSRDVRLHPLNESGLNGSSFLGNDDSSEDEADDVLAPILGDIALAPATTAEVAKLLARIESERGAGAAAGESSKRAAVLEKEGLVPHPADQPQPATASQLDRKPVGATLAGSGRKGLDEGIPQSFADIYKLSNTNRKRNKTAKRKGGAGDKDDAGGGGASHNNNNANNNNNNNNNDDDQDEPPSNLKKKSRGDADPAAGGDDPAALAEVAGFMSEIGWLPEKPDQQGLAKLIDEARGEGKQQDAAVASAPAASNNNNNKGKASAANQQPFQPYRYDDPSARFVGPAAAALAASNVTNTYPPSRGRRPHQHQPGGASGGAPAAASAALQGPPGVTQSTNVAFKKGGNKMHVFSNSTGSKQKQEHAWPKK